MKKSISFYDNGKYKVAVDSCTIYVYNPNEVELMKCKDATYKKS